MTATAARVPAPAPTPTTASRIAARAAAANAARVPVEAVPSKTARPRFFDVDSIPAPKVAVSMRSEPPRSSRHEDLRVLMASVTDRRPRRPDADLTSLRGALFGDAQRSPGAPTDLSLLLPSLPEDDGDRAHPPRPALAPRARRGSRAALAPLPKPRPPPADAPARLPDDGETLVPRSALAIPRPARLPPRSRRSASTSTSRWRPRCRGTFPARAPPARWCRSAGPRPRPPPRSGAASPAGPWAWPR